MEKVYRFVGWTVVLAVAFTAALRATAIRWWQVPLDDDELGASLAPSLSSGDWVLLWRLTRPNLGDLVMCPDPDDPTNVVIGRILAEAHDVVTIQGHDLRVNGERLDIEYNCTEQTFKLISPDSQKEVELYCDMEVVGDALHKRGYLSNDKRKRRKYENEVGSGEIFLMSDNRAFPFDSRHYGTLKRSACQETVFFRLISKAGFFDVNNRLSVIR